VGRAIDPEPGDYRLDHSICPGVPCPETVLVARMTGGGYLLVAYPHPGTSGLRGECRLNRSVLNSVLCTLSEDWREECDPITMSA
jgi:hypothetical protein